MYYWVETQQLQFLVSALLLGQLQVVELNGMFLTVTPVFW